MTSAEARVTDAQARGDKLETQLRQTLVATDDSEAAALWSHQHKAFNTFRSLVACCRQAWETAGLGSFKFPAHGEVKVEDPLRLVPQLSTLAGRLELLEEHIRESVEGRSRELASKAVAYTMASLWSHLPNTSMERVREGIRSRPVMRSDTWRLMWWACSHRCEGGGGAGTLDPPTEDGSDASSDASQ